MSPCSGSAVARFERPALIAKSPDLIVDTALAIEIPVIRSPAAPWECVARAQYALTAST